jgi:hypothetical protein
VTLPISPTEHQVARHDPVHPNALDMQKRLLARGYDIGPTGADGIFGTMIRAPRPRVRRLAGCVATRPPQPVPTVHPRRSLPGAHLFLTAPASPRSRNDEAPRAFGRVGDHHACRARDDGHRDPAGSIGGSPGTERVSRDWSVINGRTNTVYVANRGDDTVSVVSCSRR